MWFGKRKMGTREQGNKGLARYGIVQGVRVLVRFMGMIMSLTRGVFREDSASHADSGIAYGFLFYFDFDFGSSFFNFFLSSSCVDAC